MKRLQRARIWTVCENCERPNPAILEDFHSPLRYYKHQCGCVVNVCEILDEDTPTTEHSSLVLFEDHGSEWVNWPTMELET